jgi:hypothetical protein
LTVAAVNGVATFTDLRPRFALELSGGGYNGGLSASATGMSQITSAQFTVTPSAPTQVWVAAATAYYFSTGTCPTGVYPPGSVFPTDYMCVQAANLGFSVSAFVLDSLDNQVGAGNNVIALAVGSNPSNGTLTGSNNVTAINGEADFNVSINNGGNGYTLVASTTGLTSLPSYGFNVAAFGTANRLAFTVQPSNAAVGTVLTPALQVCVQDGAGNTVTTATDSITVAIGTNPGSGTLGGTQTAVAVSGCATFANLTLSAAGSAYALKATSLTNTSLLAATSVTFNITP